MSIVNIGRVMPGGMFYKYVHPYIEYEKAVISLCMVLSGNPRYSSVDAAVQACGMHPDTLYEIATRGDPLPVAFREALYGTGKEQS